DKVSNYLDQLVYVLFEEEYFSYSENAQVYVNKIVDFIVSEIASFPHKKNTFSTVSFRHLLYFLQIE
ncbi:MAG: hypothetical protein ACRCS4_02510, partial [Flavobacterium sp.]